MTLDTEFNITQVSIYNASGILETSFEFDNNQLDVSNLNTGVYLLKVETENGLLINRFVKE